MLSPDTSRKNQIRQQLLTGGLPPGPRYWEDEWITSWVSYAERHEPSISRGLLRTVGSEFEDRFREHLHSIWIDDRERGTSAPAMLHILSSCWTVGASLSLRVKVSPITQEILNSVLTWQQPDGVWLDARSGGEQPCSDTTAYATACLAMYGDVDRWSDALDKAIQWLLENAHDSGGWGRPDVKGGIRNLNITTTVAALEAMRLQGITSEHPAIDAAETALLAAQHATGVWVDTRGLGEDYLTPLVLRYFHRRNQRPSNTSDATNIGRALILKGQFLATLDTHADRMVALIAFHHGLEYVLYGFLVEHDVEIRSADGKTIGFREALGRFEKVAKEKLWVSAEKDLPRKTQLLELASKRDELVHRMGSVTRLQLDGFQRQVIDFIVRFDLQVLGYTLLT